MRSSRGSTKSGKGTLKATDLLKCLHREVKSLFRTVEGTQGARERRRLLERIGESLMVHTAIEETIFYPAVRRSERTGPRHWGAG
jgi:hypothetical protein